MLSAEYTSVTWVLVINIIATVIWICVLIPQFIKTVVTRDTYSISIFMYLFYPMSNVMWISYEVSMMISAVTRDILAMLINDCVGLVLSLTIFSIKIHNVLKAKKLGISEKDYYNKYIKPKKQSKKENKK